MSIDTLISTANAIAIKIGANLVTLQSAPDNPDLWRETNRMTGQLLGIIYAASVLLPPQQFSSFIERAGIGTDSVTDALAAISHSTTHDN